MLLIAVIDKFLLTAVHRLPPQRVFIVTWVFVSAISVETSEPLPLIYVGASVIEAQQEGSKTRPRRSDSSIHLPTPYEDAAASQHNTSIETRDAQAATETRPDGPSNSYNRANVPKLVYEVHGPRI
jgi:hypothetical protein